MDFAAREISSKEGVAASSWIYGNVGSLSTFVAFMHNDISKYYKASRGVSATADRLLVSLKTEDKADDVAFIWTLAQPRIMTGPGVLIAQPRIIIIGVWYLDSQC